MSYQCQHCGVNVLQGIPSHRVVAETRPVTYPPRSRANADGNDDKGGRGVEIVREVVVCPECA